MEKNKKIKVLYIAGCSRSGTTLLDRLLASSPKIISAGELNFLKCYIDKHDPGRPYKVDFSDLAGKGLEESEFWSPIIKKIKENHYFLYNIAEESGIKMDFIKRFFTNKKLKKKYNDLEVFDMILKGSKRLRGDQAEVVLDSSKGFKRLARLLDDDGLDVYVIHLIRDVRGRINSIQRYKKDPGLKIFAEWLVKNAIISLFLKKKVSPDRYIRLGYDPFAGNPAKYLREISAKFDLGVDLDNYLDSANKEMDFAFAGNNMRTKGIGEIKPDDKWRKDMGVFKKGFFTVLGFIPNKIWVYGRKE